MNIYMLAKIGGKVVDLTDIKQVMVHGSDNYKRAEEMLRTMTTEKVGEYFCTNCGNYMSEKKCNCMSTI